MLSFSYYLHEKADESRHNESICFMVAILGSIFFIGGTLQTLLTTQTPQWLLIIPYQPVSSPYDFLGLAFTLLGVALFIGGILLTVHYASQRLWYTNALKESYKFEEQKLRAKNKHQNSQDNTPSLLTLPETTAETNPITDILEPKPENHTTVEKEA